jgi:lipopolysaccharide export system permease protein
MLIERLKRLAGKLTGRGVPWTFYSYILSEVTKPFLGAAAFFFFVLMMFQVIRLSDFFVIHNVSALTIIGLMSYLSLTFLPVIIPIAFLLAVLLGFGRLSSDGEVLAMRASGVSVYSMLTPVLGLGFVIFLASLIANFYFTPYGMRGFRYELFRISNTRAIATIHEGTFTEGFFDLILYADKVNNRESTLERVLIYDERDKNSAPVTVVAKWGQIINNYQDANGVPGLVLRLFDGALHRGDEQSGVYEMTEFKQYDIFLRIETAKVIGVEQPRTMDIHALSQQIDEIRAMEHPRREDLSTLKDNVVEFWKRIVLSVSCLIFAVLGVAFGVVKTRAVRSNSFLICLLVLLGYWVIYSFGYDLSDRGQIPAWIGMWFANAVLTVIALVALRRVSRN